MQKLIIVPIWHFCSRRSVIISLDRNREFKTKIGDLPPAKYNPGAEVKNSLVASGCIINGTVENSVLFKKSVYVGNNCVIRNSVILNDVYIGDNTVIENCIVESRDTIRAIPAIKVKTEKSGSLLKKMNGMDYNC